jgi:hypothetical protein
MPVRKKLKLTPADSLKEEPRRRKPQKSRNARIGRETVSRKRAQRSVEAAKMLSDSESVFRRIDTVKGELERLEAGYRKKLYANLTSLYDAAMYLYEHREAWEQFCLDERWLDKAQHKRKPKPDKPEDALRFVLRLALSGTAKQVNNKSSKYFRALKALWGKKAMVNRVRSRLKEHGVEGLIAQRKPTQTAKDDKAAKKSDAKACPKKYRAKQSLRREWPVGNYTGSAEVFIDENDGQRKLRLELIPA